MGLLTTGLYVPFAMVLPYIVAFYLMLSIMEDSGYLPRLATLTDTFFHRLGMHGYGIIPLFLGLGCNVPGVLATRVLETRKQRFIAATLLGISIPCMAQIAMIFGVLGPFGMRYVAAVFLTLAAVYLAAGLVLNRFVGGECPEIFLELPPYRMPGARMTLKKTWMRVRGFIMEAIPYLFLGILIVNLLYTAGILDMLGTLLAPVMEGWLGLPAGASTALLVGILRKDLAVGMLIPLGMTPAQAGDRGDDADDVLPLHCHIRGAPPGAGCERHAPFGCRHDRDGADRRRADANGAGRNFWRRTVRKKTIEEYIETIYALEKREERAQTGMIAQEIDVKPPSVTEMLRKLEKCGLIEYESYSGATLTPTGRKMACDLQKKHKTVASFLEMLGVDHEIADADACQIEHHVSPETAERLRLFVDFLRGSPFGRECMERFGRYCREQER